MGLANNITDIRSVAVHVQGSLAELKAKREELERYVDNSKIEAVDNSGNVK